MTDRHRRWAALAWTDFAALDPERTVVVLPVAAIEQHGPHLPLEVDAAINRAVLDAALARTAPDTRTLTLPAIVVGKSDEHQAFPGTLTLGTETLLRVWYELGESVHRAGLRKLAIVNSHGGQGHVARIVAQDLRVRLGMVTAVANTYGFGQPEGLFPESEERHGIHAGAAETSVMLHVAPQAVRHERIADFPAASSTLEARARELRFHGNGGMGWAMQDLNAQGACGDARLASAEAGQAIVEHAGARLARLLDELAAYPLAALQTAPQR